MLILFYAGLFYKEYDSWLPLINEIKSNPEIYNGGYIYDPRQLYNEKIWYRCDGTSLLEEDVPSQLKAYILLLGD